MSEQQDIFRDLLERRGKEEYHKYKSKHLGQYHEGMSDAFGETLTEYDRLHPAQAEGQRDIHREWLETEIARADSDAALDQADEVRTGIPYAEATVLRATLAHYNDTAPERERERQALAEAVPLIELLAALKAPVYRSDKDTSAFGYTSVGNIRRARQWLRDWRPVPPVPGEIRRPGERGILPEVSDDTSSR